MFTTAVNNTIKVNISPSFAAKALRILAEIPGLEVVRRTVSGNRGADAVICYAGKRAPIAVEVRQRANAATAWQFVQRVKDNPNVPLLLITGHSTLKARQILAQHGIAIVDGLGNAHFELPGLLFHLEGKRTASGDTSAPTRLRGKAGLVAQALLVYSTRIWQVKSLAETAKVSPALVHRVLTRLERERIVNSRGAGPNLTRQVTNFTALLDLWVEEAHERPSRTRAHVLAQTPKHLIETISKRLTQAEIGYAITGAAAASLIAPLLTALPVVDVWVQSALPSRLVIGALEAQPVENGQNVNLLQEDDDSPMVFHQTVGNVTVVNKFRLYADLLRSPKRGAEQANHLRREVIGF